MIDRTTIWYLTGFYLPPVVITYAVYGSGTFNQFAKGVFVGWTMFLFLSAVFSWVALKTLSISKETLENIVNKAAWRVWSGRITGAYELALMILAGWSGITPFYVIAWVFQLLSLRTAAKLLNEEEADVKLLPESRSQESNTNPNTD